MPKRRPKLTPLTDRGREIVAFVLNAVAFQTWDDDAELESLGRALGTTGARLRPMLRKLETGSWLTVEGKSLEFVYPTVAALRWQSPDLDEKAAAAIVTRLRRGRMVATPASRGQASAEVVTWQPVRAGLVVLRPKKATPSDRKAALFGPLKNSALDAG